MCSVQHVEFFHRDHFEFRYHRTKATKELSQFIDFFWETDFDELYSKHPQGFSDALFRNIGYTYLINLGTPFTMQLDDQSFEIKGDGFLPRNCDMICHHSTGNKIFGIKFKVSPIVFQRDINFAEYKEYIFPLAYLIDRSVVAEIKKATDFSKRVNIISAYYANIISQYSGSLKHVDIVTEILCDCNDRNTFDLTIEDLSAQYKISSRTLQRYFQKATGIGSKQALQIMRIRKAIESLIAAPDDFRSEQFGYYDYSHFYKHLKSFISSQISNIPEPHLMLLRGGSFK
jgi:AraC-like DNA-binding protein